MPDYRKVSESVITQGENESIYYYFDFTKMGIKPLNPVVTLNYISSYKRNPQKGEEIGLGGSPVINDFIVTTPAIAGLKKNQYYRVSCLVDIGLNRIEAYFNIYGAG